MNDAAVRTSASRAALLELHQEREVVQQGRDFLDEKRILLARELLRRLDGYREDRISLDQAEQAARGALRRAIERHGLEYLQLQEPPATTRCELGSEAERFLGVSLPRVELRVEFREPNAVPGAPGECSARFADVARLAAKAAAEVSIMLRLIGEYRRTERRVRALENLILPELQARERDMAEVLEENELEEAIRVRLFAGQGRFPA